MNERQVACVMRVEDGRVVLSYMFPAQGNVASVTANTRMTPDEAENYRFMLAHFILLARGGVDPRPELVDRMHGRVRLIACARLPHEPPSDDDAARLEPMPMAEARALLDYIAKLEQLLRVFAGRTADGELEPYSPDEILRACNEARKLLGIPQPERSHGTPPAP
jgi:hypothetical protein